MFLGNFQKPLGGASCFWEFLGSFEEPPGDESLYRQATQTCNQFLGFVDELSGGDEHPLGDTSRIYLVLMFCVFWGDSNRGKMKSYLIIDDVMCYIVKLYMVGGSI